MLAHAPLRDQRTPGAALSEERLDSCFASRTRRVVVVALRAAAVERQEDFLLHLLRALHALLVEEAEGLVLLHQEGLEVHLMVVIPAAACVVDVALLDVVHAALVPKNCEVLVGRLGQICDTGLVSCLVSCELPRARTSYHDQRKNMCCA